MNNSNILSFLFIAAPSVEIVDDGEKPLKDKIFKTDSTLELRCIVRQVLPTNSQHVSWYHRHPHLNYDVLLNNDTRHRGGIRWVCTALFRFCICNMHMNEQQQKNHRLI